MNHKPRAFGLFKYHPDQPYYPLLNGVHTPLPDSPPEPVEVLKAIPYKDYLRSAHWQAKRKALLREGAARCERCRATQQLEIHHLTYDRLGREFESDLVVLCSKCHRREHGRAIP